MTNRKIEEIREELLGYLKYKEGILLSHLALKLRYDMVKTKGLVYGLKKEGLVGVAVFPKGKTNKYYVFRNWGVS